MLGQLIGVKAFFSLPGGEETKIIICEDKRQVMRAEAERKSDHSFGFPRFEIVRRSGVPRPEVLRMLEQTILEVCTNDLLHRYGEVPWSDTNTRDGRWSIILRYYDGTVKRWQGMCCAPAEIDKVYDAFVDFGMPSLNLGYWDSYSRLMSDKTPGDLLLRIQSYLDDICSVFEHDEDEDEEAEAELSLLVSSLCEDMRLAAKWPLSEEQLAGLLSAWNVPVSIEGVCSADVDKASRTQMISLFWALSCLPNAKGCLEQLVNTGVLNSWRRRMSEIPLEERAEKKRQLEEEHARTTARIASDIECRMATKRPFTSRDVAQATATTARRASAIIRQFVKSGALEKVAQSNPAQYVLSSSITRRREELPQAS